MLRGFEFGIGDPTKDLLELFEKVRFEFSLSF